MPTPDFDSLEEQQQAKDKDISEEVRTIWIEEVRRYHQRTTGRASAYKPGPQLDGGRNAQGKLFKPVWPKVAKFITDNNLDPQPFIRAQFRVQSSPPPSPLVMLSAVAIARYKRSHQSKEELRDIVLAKDIQIRQTKDALEYYKRLYPTTEHAYKALLLDENIALSALFRYCLAMELGYQDIASMFFTVAMEQYRRDRQAYDQVYKGFIPDDLKS